MSPLLAPSRHAAGVNRMSARVRGTPTCPSALALGPASRWGLFWHRNVLSEPIVAVPNVCAKEGPTVWEGGASMWVRKEGRRFRGNPIRDRRTGSRDRCQKFCDFLATKDGAKGTGPAADGASFSLNPQPCWSGRCRFPSVSRTIPTTRDRSTLGLGQQKTEQDKGKGPVRGGLGEGNGAKVGAGIGRAIDPIPRMSDLGRGSDSGQTENAPTGFQMAPRGILATELRVRVG